MRLEARDLSHRFHDRVLFENVSFTLKDDQLRVLFGPSGAGKSTLIRILAGLVSPHEGRILLDDVPFEETDPQDWRRRVVLLHQTPRMFPGSVEDNLRLAADYHDLSVDPSALLERCRLEVGLDQPAGTLSGGEQKRLALARALSVRPRFLLLDEPTASLDERSRRTIDGLIRDLSGDTGVLVVTHNPREIEELDVPGYRLEGGRFERLTAGVEAP